MEALRTVHIHLIVEAKIPANVDTRTLGMGIAGSKINDNFKPLPDAQIATWWIERVVACNSRYITCPKCNKVALLSHDCVILDDKPLCIHCSAEFQHGDLPVPRTEAEKRAQLNPPT